MRYSALRFAGAAVAIAISATPSVAGVYQALCAGNSECTVTLANGQLSAPGVVIKKDQVLSWSQGGSGSKTDVGMGVAGLVVFGLPGLIGFAAKKHDYTYTISYVDEAGNIQTASFGFKNNVPANQFMMEMMGMTGLSVGEVNKDLEARLEQIKAEASEKARIAALECSRALKPYNCSWSAYAAANPAVEIWANKYPTMVPAEKARLRAVD